MTTAQELDRLTRHKDDLFCIDESATVVEAALKMTANHVGSLVVTRGLEIPAGMLTERDILRRVVASGRDAFSLTVADIMSPGVISCGTETTVSAIQQMMATYQIRHVPIVDAGAVVGIVTSRDIHAHERAMAERAAESARAKPPRSAAGEDGDRAGGYCPQGRGGSLPEPTSVEAPPPD